MKTNRCLAHGVNLVRLWLALSLTQALAVAAFGSETVKLSIICSKQEWFVGEPLVLQLDFKNVSETNQFVETELQNGVGWAGYWISSDGTNYTEIGANVFHDPVGRKTSITANESLYHEEILWFNSRTGRSLFTNAGDYFLRVDCRGRTSNALKIHVKNPTRDIDKNWANVFQTREVLLAGTRGGQKSDAAVKLLQECANTLSTYSPYAAYFLAQTELEKTNALALYEKADVADFPLQGRAVYEKARINLELGEKAKAKANELFQRIANDFPNSAAASEVKRKNLLESSKP